MIILSIIIAIIFYRIHRRNTRYLERLDVRNFNSFAKNSAFGCDGYVYINGYGSNGFQRIGYDMNGLHRNDSWTDPSQDYLYDNIYHQD